MRKFLIGALVAGSMAVTGALAMPAHATSVCPTGPTVTNSGTGGTLSVGTPAGCLTASGDAASQSGYAVADGASSNPGAGSGYIGVDGSDGVTVVGCASGDYTPGGGTQYDPPPATGPDTRNHVVVSQNHPPSVPPATDSCTPSAP